MQLENSGITDFLGLLPQKLMGSTNPLLKIDGFGRTHRTHADGATVLALVFAAIYHII